MRTSFWTYFTSGYGTLWLVLLAVGLISQSHIDAGLFGLIGFPIIAIIYACIRRSLDSEAVAKEPQFLPPRMAEFLNAHPEFLNSSEQMREAAFRKWLVDPGL